MLSFLGTPRSVPAAELSNVDLRPIQRRQSYPSYPPAFANDEALRGKWRIIQNRILNRPLAVLPDAHMIRVSGATVFGNGAVLLPHGELIAETLPAGADPATPIAAPRTHYEGTTALLRKPGDSNFGHWLIELLPRVFEFREAFPDLPLKFAVPFSWPPMLELRRETLGWLGIAEADILWLPPEPASFDDLLLISSNSIHSHTHHADGISRLVELVHGQIERPEPKSRLYVRRPPGIKRQLIGEAEIIEIAKAYGLVEVAPETMTIGEQVKLFRSAEIIVGVSGAALTNTLWASPPCRVLSLNPNIGHEFFFWDIANIRGLEFSFLFGEATTEAILGHSDFSVDPNLVKDWFEADLRKHGGPATA